MLPSLFTSDGNARPWSVPRAALYGAGIGLAAALIKIFGPFHAADWALPVVLENRCCGSRLWAALRRRCTAAQSAGATAPGHATLKAVIRQIKQRRNSPGRMAAWDRPAALGPSKTRFLLAVALHKIKFHPGIWDATGRDNALN
jgi:hypothetical protein